MIKRLQSTRKKGDIPIEKAIGLQFGCEACKHYNPSNSMILLGIEMESCVIDICKRQKSGL